MYVCAHAWNPVFYRLAKRHMSGTAHDTAVERTRHPAREKNYGCGSNQFFIISISIDWHVFSVFPDPEHQDSETTEMFAQSWSIYLKVAFPWRVGTTARFKVRSKKPNKYYLYKPFISVCTRGPISFLFFLACWQQPSASGRELEYVFTTLSNSQAKQEKKENVKNYK